MKIILPLIALVWVAAAHAQQPVAKPTVASAPDLVTMSGKTYKHASVFRVEPDGITYMFTGGMVKILFTDLPDATRKQYGYDPARAESFARADDLAQQETFRSVQSQGAEEARKRQAVNEDAAADLANSTALKTSGLQTGSLDGPSSSGLMVTGKVIRVIDDGILIHNGYRSNLLLTDYPNADSVRMGGQCHVSGQRQGEYVYENELGERRHATRVHYISGSITDP